MNIASNWDGEHLPRSSIEWKIRDAAGRICARARIAPRSGRELVSTNPRGDASGWRLFLSAARNLLQFCAGGIKRA